MSAILTETDVTCVVASTGAENASFTFTYIPPPLPAVFYVSKTSFSAKGGDAVSVVVRNLFVDNVKNMLITIGDATFAPDGKPPIKRRGRPGQYEVRFFTPALASIGATTMTLAWVGQSGGDVTMNIALTITPASAPEIAELLPSYGWTTGGEGIQMVLKSKPGGATSATVDFGGHGSVTVPLNAAREQLAFVSLQTPAIDSSFAGAVTVTVSMDSGDYAATCGCATLTLTYQSFVYKSPPLPLFRYISPDTAPLQGGTAIEVGVNNLGKRNGANLVVSFRGTRIFPWHLQTLVR